MSYLTLVAHFNSNFSSITVISLLLNFPILHRKHSKLITLNIINRVQIVFQFSSFPFIIQLILIHNSGTTDSAYLHVVYSNFVPFVVKGPPGLPGFPGEPGQEGLGLPGPKVRLWINKIKDIDRNVSGSGDTYSFKIKCHAFGLRLFYCCMYTLYI